MSAAVDAAIDATRHAGTARLRYRLQPDGPAGERPYGLDGVADLARCRVALPGVVWHGQRSFRGDGAAWRPTPAIAGWAAVERHPLWLLLDGIRLAEPNALGRAVLDGHEVSRVAVRVEPRRRSVRRRHARAELWVDGDGLVRLASIRIQTIGIASDPALARAAEQLAGTRENPAWNTTELFDFGVAAEIPELPVRPGRFGRAGERAPR
jgi:hypothetical protein